jgi:TrmH family RNA methyltransferase
MITSLQNQRIKDVIKLTNPRERLKRDLFVIEGVRELSMAIEGGYTVCELFICEELLNSAGKSLVEKSGIAYVTVSVDVFNKMAYRDETQGIIALSRPRHLSLDSIKLSENPLVIVLESLEKPGNLGAILRTAEATGVDAIIVCDKKTDIYNANTIRSSLGTVFTQQIVVCTSKDALNWLYQSEIRVVTTDLNADRFYHEIDLTRPTAIIMGSEADGLTDFWISNADDRIRIPMHGKVDSLNVSVSTAVIVFEAVRQRKLKP